MVVPAAVGDTGIAGRRRRRKRLPVWFTHHLSGCYNIFFWCPNSSSSSNDRIKGKVALRPLFRAVIVGFAILFGILQATLYSKLPSLRQAQTQKSKRSVGQNTLPRNNAIAQPWRLTRKTTTTASPSKVHCVGENFLPNAWRFKSCYLQNLCFDSTANEFVLFRDKNYDDDDHWPKSPYTRSSTHFLKNHSGVSAGPLHPKRSRPWFPTIRPWNDFVAQTQTFYLEIPPNVTWVPFAITMASADTAPRRITTVQIWMDYLMPIYNLVAMFGLEDSHLLLSILENNDNQLKRPPPPQQQQQQKPPPNYDEFETFLPFLKLAQWNQSSFWSSLTTSFRMVSELLSHDRRQRQQQQQEELPPPLVCARHAVVGLGPLTDHGTKWGHGEYIQDYQFAQNVARGPLFRQFQTYAMQNMAGHSPTRPNNTAHIVAMAQEQQTFEKQLDFVQQHRLESWTNRRDVSLRALDISKLSWMDRIKALQAATVVISNMGEDALPAFFLPPGSALILYYDSQHKFAARLRNNNKTLLTTRPAMMDWDLWNHMSHLSVHWLPSSSGNTPEGLNTLWQIIQEHLEHLVHKQSRGKRQESGNNDDQELYFGGERISYIPHPPSYSSHVSCLGDNFVPMEAPCYRSCHIDLLCMDLEEKEMVVFASDTQRQLEQAKAELGDAQFASINTAIMAHGGGVMEGRNIRFSTNQPWFPKVVLVDSAVQLLRGYYLLPPQVFWIPYTLETSYASNPGHLMWDFFLPFFTLLSMYSGHGDDQSVDQHWLFLTSLDSACLSLQHCRDMVTKLFPLIQQSGQHPAAHVLTLDNLSLQKRTGGGKDESESMVTLEQPKSNLVCAEHGAVGIGMLTDHGFTRHGQNLEDYRNVHNSGRGVTIFHFRSFVLQTMGLSENEIHDGVRRRRRHGGKQKVIFSVNSSANVVRRKDFAQQIAAAKASILGDAVDIHVVELARLTLTDQVRLVLDASVFVSVVGGSTSIATLLPRRATVVLFFVDDGNDFVGNTKRKDFPAMMDFDFWNNASHLRLHWLPTSTMDSRTDVTFLLKLIRSGLDNDNF